MTLPLFPHHLIFSHTLLLLVSLLPSPPLSSSASRSKFKRLYTEEGRVKNEKTRRKQKIPWMRCQRVMSFVLFSLFSHLNHSHVQSCFGSQSFSYMSRRFRSIRKGCFEDLKLLGFDCCSRSTSLGSSCRSFIIPCSWCCPMIWWWRWTSWVSFSCFSQFSASSSSRQDGPSCIRWVSCRRRWWRRSKSSVGIICSIGIILSNDRRTHTYCPIILSISCRTGSHSWTIWAFITSGIHSMTRVWEGRRGRHGWQTKCRRVWSREEV